MNEPTTDSVSSAEATAASMAAQYLTFGLAGEQFAIPILAVQEIRGWEKVSRTPHAPGHVLGVMNLRGAVVPVLDLRARLGMDLCERTSTSVVIVVRVDTSSAAAVTVGCLVDGVSDVVNLSADRETPAPSACGTMDTHFLTGVATMETQLVMLLDLVRLVETSIAPPAYAIRGSEQGTLV
jgi:purine-binding chemotaxis protein CheW